MRRANSVIAVVLTVIGCGSAPTDEIRSETAEIGDPIVVTTRGEQVPVRDDSVRLIWASPQLENPRALVLVGDRLSSATRTPSYP